MTIEIAIVICAFCFLVSVFFFFFSQIKNFFIKPKKVNKNKKERVIKSAKQIIVRPIIKAENETTQIKNDVAKDRPILKEKEEPILKSFAFDSKSESDKNLINENKTPKSYSNYFSSKTANDFKTEFNDIKNFLNVSPTDSERHQKNSNMIKSKTPKDFFLEEDIKFFPVSNNSSVFESDTEKELSNFNKPNFFEKPNLNFDRDDFLNFEEEIDLNKLSPKMKKLIITDILKRKYDDE